MLDLSGYKPQAQRVKIGIVAFNAHIATEAKEKLTHAQAGRWTMHEGTNEQKEIWGEMQRVDGQHMVVDAGAGTGKTYTMMTGAVLLGGPGMGGVDVDVMTYHQLGRRALVSAGARLRDMDKYRVHGMLKGMGIDRAEGDGWRTIQTLAVKLVGIMKGSLARERDHVQGLADGMGLDLTLFDKAFRWAEKVVDAQIKQGLSPIIDFDDMIWLPVVLGLDLPRFDILVIDESQDTNPCQAELAMRAKGTGRLIVVGDRRQAIYAFRGADRLAMDRLSEGLRRTDLGVVTLKLMESQRCPRVVVELAQAVVPEYRAKDGAKEGTFTVLKDEEKLATVAEDGDMVLCRVNAPLIRMAYQFIKQGKKAVVRGKDFGERLRYIVEGIAPWTQDGVYGEVERWKDMEAEVLRREGEKAEGRLNKLFDEYDCLKEVMAATTRMVAEAQANGAVITETHNYKVELLRKIDEIFSDVKVGIVLSTVHRAKGLEAARVWVIRPELMPHPKARANEMEQEMNLFYVAVTRSMDTIGFVGGVPSMVEETEVYRKWQKENKKKDVCVLTPTHQPIMSMVNEIIDVDYEAIEVKALGYGITGDKSLTDTVKRLGTGRLTKSMPELQNIPIPGASDRIVTGRIRLAASNIKEVARKKK